MRRLGFAVVTVAFGLAWPLAAQAGDPDVVSRYPTSEPVRERVWNVDDQAPWTLRQGDAAVPLMVVPTPGRTLVAQAGGWTVLGPDLEFSSTGLSFLASNGPHGTPWAQAAEAGVVFVTGSPGDLAVLYPDTGVVIRRSLDLSDLSFFAVTAQGFTFVQGRRASAAADWNRSVREVQPLPFFPSDVVAAEEGTAWASDSLQARPWRQDEGFWKPLDFPHAPGRLTSLAPFPDSTGYFASGAGWVGAFSSDGTAYWVRDKDRAGRSLPRDLKVRTGTGRLYLWSAQARRVWCWGWDSEGPSGTVGAPSEEFVAQGVLDEITRLEALGSVPEAQSAALYGTEWAAQSQSSQALRSDFESQRLRLRTRVIGAGVFVIDWASPYDAPLASWSWQPDAEWSDVKAWRVSMLPFWEGRLFEGDDFALAFTGELAPWPNVSSWRQGDLRLPSWMSLEFRPDGTDSPVHWTRVPLPSPPVPYDLPVE